jgi:PAS domain S-box-containing protein
MTDRRAYRSGRAQRRRIRALDVPESGWRLFLVGVVAVLSLVALVAAPSYYEGQVGGVERTIEYVFEPAARLSADLRLFAEPQFVRMDGFLATGDDRRFRDPYNQAVTKGDAILRELQGIADELALMGDEQGVWLTPGSGAPSPQELLAEVIVASNEWRYENQQIFELVDSIEYTEREPVDLVVEREARDSLAAYRNRVQAGYEALDSATAALDDAILSEIARGRAVVSDAQEEEARVTFGLAVLALLSTLSVARGALRFRALTVEREVRRRSAVEARREIDALLRATGDGVLGIDLEGRCMSLNRAGSELLGYSESEIVGRDFHDTLLHTLPGGEPSPRDASHVMVAVAQGKPLESEEGAILWRRGGESFPARWSLRPMIDGTELRGAVLTFTDMSEIREKEEALRRAIRQREDVVSIVSHDLRNPLGVAMASADLLLDLPLDEQQRRRQAEIIRRSGKRMQRLIEDLLDVARIEAGALVVRPSREMIVPILHEAAEQYRDQARARQLVLTVDAGSDELEARIDRDRILQALGNLLDNAVRLTPEGGSILLSARDRGDDVLISVADTGPGIAPSDMARLFDRFAQVEDRDSGAAGLGLTIVRGVAHAHGGEVEVRSREGRGSVFTLRLPKLGPAEASG